MIMRYSTLAAVAAIAFSLSGCAGLDAAWSGANNYYSGALKSTQKNIQGTNDNTAATWADAGCALPYGEVVRNGSGNPNLPSAVITLCGAPSGFTMIHSTPTATATTTIPTETITAPATSTTSVTPAAPIPSGTTPSSSAAPVISNKTTAQAQAATAAFAARIAALSQQH